jgi:hypothetical protein
MQGSHVRETIDEIQDKLAGIIQMSNGTNTLTVNQIASFSSNTFSRNLTDSIDAKTPLTDNVRNVDDSDDCLNVSPINKGIYPPKECGEVIRLDNHHEYLIEY